VYCSTNVNLIGRDVDETSKSKKHWGPAQWSVLQGSGIDIGCGPDPITPEARRFDVEDGDANCITRYVHDQFDFVYSSHCLEHMFDPRSALREWWQLVKPGGHLFFIVPDEDLYEQGVFPSRFNRDHKATFTICKAHSWSPVSYNVLDLALGLPDARLVSIVLQDQGYDRRLLKHGETAGAVMRFMARQYKSLEKRLHLRIGVIERALERRLPVDQTSTHGASAQIECVVQKMKR